MLKDDTVTSAESVATVCPRCASQLATHEDQPPWCEQCEWNLDAYVPPRHAGWLLRSIARLDQRAGFRADSLLAATVTDELTRRDLRSGVVVLRAISALLVLLPLTALAGAAWLISAAEFGTTVLAMALLAVAYLLRPRLGRLRRVLRGCYRLKPEQTPAIHGLINRIADVAGAPRPQLVLLSLDWNAAVTTVGLRRTRVMILGIPLLVSIQPQELVALLTHELGHLLHQDSRRNLLTQPALTLFGLLSQAVRAPDVPSGGAGPFGGFLVIWQLVGGALSWLLWIIHLGLNIVDARERRRAELRADLLAARTAGTSACLGLFDTFVLIRAYESMIDGGTSRRGAVQMWRQRIALTRERHEGDLPRLRQLTKRTEASLFAHHPATGRRHQILSTVPDQPPAVVVTEAEAQRLDAELSPYAESVRKLLAEAYEM